MKQNSIKRLSLFAVGGLLLTACQKQADTPLTQVGILLSSNAVMIGDGGAATALDIGICGEAICAVSAKGSVQYNAKKRIELGEQLIAPGFIDPHTHSLSELKNINTAANLNYLTQGVTTVVNGNDGAAIVDVAGLKHHLTEQGIGTNTALLVGHGSVREKVMGRAERHATDAEVNAMKSLVEQAMRDGAIGLSTGLYYVPGSYAATEEVIALAKVAAKYDGIYDTHLRDESTFNVGFTQAVTEAINIAKAANIHLHLAHIKALGVDVWGQSGPVIEKVEQAQAQGVSISADQYPWRASGTHLHSAVVPKWVMADSSQAFVERLNNPELKDRILSEIKENIRRRGGPNALLFTVADDQSLVGKTLEDVAKERGKSANKLVVELVQGNPIRVASFNMSPDDIRAFMVKPWVVTSSDGTDGHPRKYASFPKKYRQYVKQEQLMTLAKFVKQSSFQTAKLLKLPKRGLIKVGYAADIIGLDIENYRDKATFSNWNKLSTGVETVFVNGVQVIEQGQYIGQLPGKVLTKR